ncbi:UDP-glycosyltransferase UGT5-like [Musca vetustissima]|uniref:UDP-glycosyltransferase UGT5-like n=1 Tax=Musca vetustissima TaxID=27455 RepID=UPI002AB6CAAA|nr:UDP-glycosyltransferase UGT5-like [Musca vetustissima]
MLASKGYEVTSINAFPQKQKVANFRDIPVTEVFDNYADVISGAQVERNKWDEMTFLSEFFYNITETVLKNRQVQNLMQNEHFDLVIVETILTDAWYGLGRHFQAPIIGVSSFGTDPVIDELMGNMSPFSYTPLVTIGYTENMTYMERLWNVIYQLLELLHVRMVSLPRQRTLMAKYMPHIKEDLWELRSNFSLMLLNQHFSLSYPRPYVPSMIQVGGFQLHYKSNPLPADIQEFLNSTQEDVIYFSMGSNVKSKDFPPERLAMINEIFRKLPYKILWKFENTQLPGKPDNVFIKPWFPQPDVLAHPRVKLFISHGGLLSTTESVYHGKPMLGLPVFYDQTMNINKAKRAGFALSVNFYTLPKEEFEAAILEMMNNRKYLEKAKEISRIYHDQPVKPLDLAVFWTEYVLRHRGAPHLQSPAQKMSFVKKHSIDTVGVLIAEFVVIALLFICPAKILAIFPFPGPSQYILVQPYLKALAARGHEVTSVNAFPQKKAVANFRDISVTEVFDNYAGEEGLKRISRIADGNCKQLCPIFYIFFFSDFIAGTQVEVSKWQEMTLFSEFFYNVTETVYKNQEFQNLLHNEHFDLIILEALHTDGLYCLGRHFQAPLIGLSSFGTDPVIDELMGNMSPFSYTPLVTIGYTDRMTYKERMWNVIYQLMELLHVRLVGLPRHRKLMAKYMPHIKEDLWELRTNFSLMFLNQHFSLSYPRPYVPSMVEVGGFQINYQPNKLPEDVLEFINSSQEDVIYFSMGSNVKSKDFPTERIQMIIDIFRKLPYKILWKFENPQLPVEKPPNVFIKPWFPQPDILAHPRVKLFISHGGLLSTTEAIYHGKPILGLPVFYDQAMNVNKAKQMGFALGINFYTLPKEELESAILEMMTNPRYRNRIMEISNIYHDQPMKPLDVAIYWTEYVLRHRGATHLQTPAQKMSFIEKHSIDTVGVLIAAVILILVLIDVAIGKIFNNLFSMKENKQKVY